MSAVQEPVCVECVFRHARAARFVPTSVERWVRSHAEELGYSPDNTLDVLHQLETDEDLRRQMPSRTRREFAAWQKWEKDGGHGRYPRGHLDAPINRPPCSKHGRRFSGVQLGLGA